MEVEKKDGGSEAEPKIDLESLKDEVKNEVEDEENQLGLFGA